LDQQPLFTRIELLSPRFTDFGRLPMRIDWDRARVIFNYPEPPREVWEQQFDYNQDDLRRIATTHWEDFDFDDLWYYHHDLAYVELQPDLFNYLFPVCLMDWHLTLQGNHGCSHGDSEFHYGVHLGKVFERMMTSKQRQQVYEFFRDSFLDRLDQERGFVYRGSQTPAYGWMARFNSVALIMPHISMLWDSWWSLDSAGQAVAALQYCSGLMYFDGENPFFEIWSRDDGGGGPYLWGNDARICDSCWLPQNVEYLQKTLTVDFVNARVEAAVERLREEPEFARAELMRRQLDDRQELIASRVKELPQHLAGSANDDWLI
jgi:hypothetical protein